MAALDVYREIGDEMVVVHGHCPTGADAIADVWCLRKDVRLERHPADWKRWGKAAGPKRNEEMVELGADVCLAFIKNKSKGATHCSDLAEAADITTVRWVV